MIEKRPFLRPRSTDELLQEHDDGCRLPYLCEEWFNHGGGDLDHGREALIGFVGSHGDEPVSTFKIVGTYDALIESGRFVLQERNGLRVLVDLSKQDNTEAIAILEEVLLQLKS